jgi:hypothetical protein
MDPSEDPIPLDRWAVPLDEPVAEAPPPVPVGGQPPSDEPPADTLRFPLTTDVPTAEFQPQLLRFGKAG